MTPCLLYDIGKTSLHVNWQQLFTTSSLLAGISCLFATLWAFSIQYPKKAHDFYKNICGACLCATVENAAESESHEYEKQTV